MMGEFVEILIQTQREVQEGGGLFNTISIRQTRQILYNTTSNKGGCEELVNAAVRGGRRGATPCLATTARIHKGF